MAGDDVFCDSFYPSLGEFHGMHHVPEQHRCGWTHTSHDDGWFLFNVPVTDLFNVIITRFITLMARSSGTT